MYRTQLKRFTSNVKTFVVSAANDGRKILATNGKETFEVKSPMEQMLVCGSTCEIHTILMIAKMRKCSIDKVEVKMTGEFDLDTFTKDKPGKITFSKIDVQTDVYSKEEDKIKLEETVNMGMEKCPVLNTFKYAGIEINKKINYH